MYQSDHLGNGFEYLSLEQPDDYEGKVKATLVRKQGRITTGKAVLYVHGFNDYFFQTEMAHAYLAQGITFYALDLRKHGRSKLPHQKHNNMRDLSEFYADVDAALTQIQTEGQKQILLSGHSTGGLLVTLYAADRKGKEQFEALFCNSPFYDWNLPKWVKRWGVPVLAFCGKHFPDWPLQLSLSTFYGYSLHREKYGEWEYNLDWKPHKLPAIWAGWVRGVRQGHQRIKKGVSIGVPVLILHSEKSVFDKSWSPLFLEGDAVLNVQDIQAGALKCEAPHRSCIAIAGGLHDLFLSSQPVREKAYQVLFHWLSQNTAMLDQKQGK